MPERSLHQFTLSPYSIKVRRILDYKKLPYRTVEVNPFARGEIIRISGQRGVPVLVEEGLTAAESAGHSAAQAGAPIVVSDSTRIASYLDARYPAPPIFPAGAEARARVALLEDWSDETFAGDLIPFKIFTAGNARRMVSQSKVFYPPRWDYELLYPLGPFVLHRLAARRRRGRSLSDLQRDYERDLDLLETTAAASPYLAGDRPTVFDFAVWGLLRTMEGLQGEELLARRNCLAAWYERMKDPRP